VSQGELAVNRGDVKTRWRRLLSRRTARLLAVSYVVKTLLVGTAWLAVPDLGERALATARAAWERVAHIP
jgi:hypothetical protein